MPQLRHCLAMSLATVLLAACSGQPSPTPEQQQASQKAANEAAANEKLGMFKQMMDMGRKDLAASIGDEIVTRYPDSKAAAEVGKQLPKLKADVQADAESSRLANLWLYQVSPMAGGTQSTATIGNSGPDDIKANLILRRHSDWGTSAYLYADQEKGFVCKGECTVRVQFDGKEHAFKAVTPDDGRPALMFRHEKDFIQRLEKAGKVSVPVTIQGKGKQVLVYETGGFNAEKWKPLSK